MTSSTLLPSPVAGSRELPAAIAPSPAVVEKCLRKAFNGLSWTYRAGCDRLLAAIPVAVWADPEAQVQRPSAGTADWQRVKRNDRREVWRAVIHGTPYYLKYYFISAWRGALTQLFRAPACRAEWNGGLFAAGAGIPAVRPVAYTLNLRRPESWPPKAAAMPPRRRRRCALLITEAVEPSQPLDEFWIHLQSDGKSSRRRSDTAQVIELLAQMIARAHQAGFEHLDMHVANVLVQAVALRRYRTVFVDLHSARRGVPLSDRAVVRNLAQLNQWFRKHSTIGDRLRFLRAYLRWRDEFEHAFEHSRPLGLSFEQLVQALAVAARRHAHRLGLQRDHRVGRDGRYFARLKLPGGWRGMATVRCKHAAEESCASRMVFDRAWWQTQLQDALRRLAQEPGPAQVCKDSHSAIVRRALLEHGADRLPVIVKRPRARNWRRRIAQLWPPSRSTRGWRIGHALLHRDVPTARPLAVLERRLGPFVLDSILVTEAIPGALDLETFLRREFARQSPTAWARLKSELCALLVSQMRRLPERGFDHRDCKASNILVVEHPQLKLLWIDMDGLRYAGELSPQRRMRPLVRLHVSLLDVPGLSRTDRLRFLKGYFTGFGTAPRAWRQAWSELQEAADKKVRAHDAHRAWKLKNYGRE